MKKLGIFFLICCGYCTAGEIETISFLNLSELGFSVSFVRDHNGGAVLEILDEKTKHKTRVVQDPNLGIKSIETRDDVGRPIVRKSFSPGRLTVEWFSPAHRRTEISRIDQEKVRITNFVVSNGSWKKETFLADSAVFQDPSCSVPKPIGTDELEKKLSSVQDLVRLVTNGSEVDNEEMHLGSNVVAKGCKNFGKYGESSLVFGFSAALDRGLRCLANLGEKYPGPLTAKWRDSVAQLLAYFEPSAKKNFTIRCEAPHPQMEYDISQRYMRDPFGAHAQALTCATPESLKNADDFPGIALNISNFAQKHFWQDQTDIASTLLHEMIHHLGYVHDPRYAFTGVSGHSVLRIFDAPIAAAQCCFPLGEKWRYQEKLKKNREQAFKQMSEESNQACKRLTTIEHGARIQ